MIRPPAPPTPSDPQQHDAPPHAPTLVDVAEVGEKYIQENAEGNEHLQNQKKQLFEETPETRGRRSPKKINEPADDVEGKASRESGDESGEYVVEDIASGERTVEETGHGFSGLSVK